MYLSNRGKMWSIHLALVTADCGTMHRQSARCRSGDPRASVSAHAAFTIGFAVQVEAMAQELTRYNFQRLVVSPFQRCIRTAQLLNTVLQLPFSSWQIDPAVCEVGVGSYGVHSHSWKGHQNPYTCADASQ